MVKSKYAENSVDIILQKYFTEVTQNVVKSFNIKNETNSLNFN